VNHVVLVVDDDRSVRTSTVRLLIARGYTAFEATTALEAVARTVEISPDAILMDLHMHPSSGVEAARRINAQDVLKHIPIIALSATTPPPDEALHIFYAVLLKPCPSDQIVATIENALRS
jgi:two-component system cell cycle response regulator DivK